MNQTRLHSLDLAARFEKLARVGGGSVRVSWARERATGQSVLLHEFQDDSHLLRLSTQYLLLAPSQKHLLACGEWDNSNCIITTNDLNLKDLRSWIEFQIAVLQGDISGSSLNSALSGAQNPSVPAASDQAGPSEFTSMFSPRKEVPIRPVSSILGPNSPIPPDAPASDFSMIFKPQPRGSSKPDRPHDVKQPPSSILGPNSPIPPDAPASDFSMIFKPQPRGNSDLESLLPPQAAKQPPGEFTRIFSSPTKDVPLSGNLNLPIPAEVGPGEFSTMFRPQPPGPSHAPELAMPPAANQPPGEFTRMFGPGELRFDDSILAAPRSSTADFGTELPGTPEPPPPTGALPAASVNLQSPAAGTGEPSPNLGGLSEYTRVIQRSSLSPPPPSPTSREQNPAPLSGIQVPTGLAQVPERALPQVAVPQVSAPAVPQVSVPVPPQVALPSPPASQFNLKSMAVMLFTALIVIAVMVVLVFALKR